MQNEQVLLHDASLKEQQCHNMAMEKIKEDKTKWTTISNELNFRMKLLETYNKLKDDPLMAKEKTQKIHPQMQDFFSDEESL